ncbi:class I SAM-dependent methyltransferase [Streptomyces sp. CC208A]|uniref:class I SAM-dependent methyltransferase n=1 Tax=Streptomyces sp. CC208A TaxID=3044573 RepID=UPI0024A7F0E5|nr:class I SAM-dependent methyltransferase [Streptomyces sp. CC208A]
MRRAHDDERLAGAYERGNRMPEPSLRSWADLIAAPAPRPAPAVLEVGTGTGMFASALARRAGARVLAVDASEAMPAEARHHHPHPAVHYVPGTAEALPAPSASFDLALLSRVVHHLPDRPRAARELARVLRPDGRVAVRTAFREHLDSLVHTYCPRLRAVDERRFPGEDEPAADFAAGGLDLLGAASFAQPVTASLTAYHARLATRPRSKFTHLTDAEFRDGPARLEAAARAERATAPEPVLERYDVAVFTPCGAVAPS